MSRRGRGARESRSAVEDQGHDDAELLENSPFDGDLDARLAARPARSINPSMTVYLGAGVLLVAGFVAGIQADKWWGSGSSSSSSGTLNVAALRSAAARLAGGGTGSATRSGLGGGGGFFSAGGAGGATIGTIKLVDGDMVYVQTTSGGVVAVKTSGTTKINISKPGTVGQLKAGQTIVVSGAAGSDGTVTASSISEGSLGTRGSGG